MDDRIERAWEMSISRGEFEGTLGVAVAEPLRRTEQGWAWGSGARGGEVTLAPLPDLRIGLLCLPRHRALLSLHGYGPAADRFLRNWELCFRRGGG